MRIVPTSFMNQVEYNYTQGLGRPSFWESISGRALPATLYMLVYTAYTFAFANNINVTLIRLLYMTYYTMTAWYILKSFSLYYSSSRFLKYLSLLLALFVVYGVILLITGTAGWKKDMPPSAFLLDYLPHILPVFAFYYFGRRGIINERWFRVFFIFFFLNVVMLYLKQQRTLIENSINGQEDFINNIGYTAASLLPLICFFKKSKTIQYVLAAVIIGFTVLCFKRGAILCAGISFIYFTFVSLKSVKSSSKLLVLLFAVSVTYVLYGYIGNLMSSNDFFYYRVMETMEGNTSGRDSIYGFFIKYFFSAENGFNIFLGNGAYGTAKIYGIEAHADWLEIAIDFGLLGLIIFSLFWISVYKNISFSKGRISLEFYTAIVMCFIFNFSRTFFSMSIGDMSFISACILGCGMGLIDSERRIIIVNKRLTR